MKTTRDKIDYKVGLELRKLTHNAMLNKKLDGPEKITRLAIQCAVCEDIQFSDAISDALLTRGRGVPNWSDLKQRIADALSACNESAEASEELVFLVGTTLIKAGTEGILYDIIKSYTNDQPVPR